MTYTKEFLTFVAKAHRDKGLSFRIQNRKDKQYITLCNKDVKHSGGSYWNTHTRLSEHVKSIFPDAYVTSGGWHGAKFDVTYRINP